MSSDQYPLEIKLELQEQLQMSRQAVSDAMEMELESWSAKWKVTPQH